MGGGDEESLEGDDSGNPFDAFFAYQLARARALQAGADGVSLEDEARVLEAESRKASRSAWSLISAPGTDEAREEHAGAALLLYLQAAARRMPELLARSRVMADAALKRPSVPDAGKVIRATSRAMIVTMLDGAGQRRAHNREHGTAGHSCSRCLMDALGAQGEGGAVSKDAFVEGVCAALAGVVCAPSIAKAAMLKG